MRKIGKITNETGVLYGVVMFQTCDFPRPLPKKERRWRLTVCRLPLIDAVEQSDVHANGMKNLDASTVEKAGQSLF